MCLTLWRRTYLVTISIHSFVYDLLTTISKIETLKRFCGNSELRPCKNLEEVFLQYDMHNAMFSMFILNHTILCYLVLKS